MARYSCWTVSYVFFLLQPKDTDFVPHPLLSRRRGRGRGRGHPYNTRSSCSPGAVRAPSPIKENISQAVLNFMAVAKYKCALNEYCQHNHLALPRYDFTYPKDGDGYIIVLHVKGKTFKSTPHGTKREGESMAASLVLKSLGISAGTEEVRTGTHHGVALHQPPHVSGKGFILACKFVFFLVKHFCCLYMTRYF